MGVEVTLRKVLREALQAIDGLPPLKSANNDYELNGTKKISARHNKYMEDAFLPSGRVEDVTLGVDGTDGYEGFYQINLFNVPGDGDLENAHFADTIFEVFQKGWTETRDGVCVKVIGFGAYPGNERDNYYMTPIRIEYVAYADRNLV